MKRFLAIFLRGLLAFLPLALSIILIVEVANWLDRSTSGLYRTVFGQQLPVGFGLVLAIVIVFVLGLLLSNQLVRWFYNLVETPFRNIPLLKSVYGALRDLFYFFDPDGKKDAGRVVTVKHPDHDIHLVGFLTRDNMEETNLELGNADKVAVYLPMSYQIGGYTVFVPREWVQIADISVEEAMKQTLTAWMPGEKKKQ